MSNQKDLKNNIRIFFDPWFMRQRGGIGRDSRAIYRQFEGDGLFQLAAANQTFKLFNFLPFRKILSLLASFGFGIYVNIGEADILFESQVSGFQLRNRSKIRIIRLHDIFPYTNPEWFRKISSYAFKNSLNSLIKFPNTIFLCNSETTLKNLKNAYPNNQINALIYPCPVEDLSTKLCNSCKACQTDLDLRKYYYSMVGTIEPRKDYGFIFSLLEIMGSSSPNFIIVGKIGWKSRNIVTRLKNESKILWLDECCDGKLREIIMHSAGFISTSIDEGFNIAAAEAKLLQKELFLRDIEIHRLNHDGAAHFFDSVNDLCALFDNHKNKDFNYLNKKSLATNSSKSLNNFPSADILNMYYNLKKFNF